MDGSLVDQVREMRERSAEQIPEELREQLRLLREWRERGLISGPRYDGPIGNAPPRKRVRILYREGGSFGG